MKYSILIALFILAVHNGCKKESSNNSKDDVNARINAFPTEPMNTSEIEGLYHMREEEKLARDVYLTLYKKWGVGIFNNIAASEQKHTDALLTLLNKYRLNDPVKSNPTGVFSDTVLQNLYTQLIKEGGTSLTSGFKVGATIEDLDINDLNILLNMADNQDIQYVYQNLNKGSRNHIRSFYEQITNSGATYSAQYISQSDLVAIISSPKETGGW